MAYVPRKKKFQLHGKLIGIVMLIIAILAMCTYTYVTQNQKEQEIFTICGWNEKRTQERLKGSFTDTYRVSDYLYYGESLALYQNDYVLGGSDDMSRKSVELVNLCNEEAITYTMESSLDRQIDTSELEPGFYALYVNDNLVKKRLVFDEVLHTDVFTTVRREGKVKEITLLADHKMLPEENQLDKNYLFLQVEEKEPKEDYVDIFIDPYGNHINANGVVETGGQGNGLKEYEQAYDAAVLLKEKLEALGLRVAISKEKQEEIISYYGENGRMEKAYVSCARYYIDLGMNSATSTGYRGMEFYHSNYASETLANAIMYAMKKNTALEPSNMYTWIERSEGVTNSALCEGIDGNKIYDALPSLRESGGLGTGAASFNGTAQENASFAKENRQGMNALSLNLLYLTNSEDVAIWKENKDTIINELANAFARGIRVIE